MIPNYATRREQLYALADEWCPNQQTTRAFAEECAEIGFFAARDLLYAVRLSEKLI